MIDSTVTHTTFKERWFTMPTEHGTNLLVDALGAALAQGLGAR